MTDHANELRRHARKIPHPQGETPGVMLRAADEIERLRAKIEAMERQEPVAWARKLGLDVPSFGCVTDLKYRPSNIPESSYIPLYALPGAQEQEPTRDWWDCLIADISAIDCMYRGSPTYAHDAYWMREHVVRMLEQRRDSLPGAQPAPSVRDGWKLVPIEPTEDMLRAMTDPFVAINGDNRKAFEIAYTAMLAAAPEAKP